MTRLTTHAAALALIIAATALPATSAHAVSESCLPGVLKSRLSEIRKKFGSIKVVSAHRPGANIRGTSKRSYHASCRAVDFVPPSGKYSIVTRWLYANHEGGVGTYTCMNHIHIDNGPYVRFQKCN
jgi:uncharacterized protein YcbK (DUF882 family)